jgi:serine/threonine protein kinase
MLFLVTFRPFFFCKERSPLPLCCVGYENKIEMTAMQNVILAEPTMIPIAVLGFLALLIIVTAVAAAIFLIVILLRRSTKSSAPPQSVPPFTSPPASQQTAVVRKCPKCGADLKAGLPEGLCPACLLQHGLATEGAAPPGSPPFTPPPLAELAKLFPQLEILDVLGQGGMGAVYKARQPSLDRFVALKILAPRSGGDVDFSGRFSREARALAKLNHPNIVAVYDFGQIQRAAVVSSTAAPSTLDPQPLSYFIMEFVDGPNLRQLEQGGKLTPREALQIIPQICGALQFAHDEGVVHRDIKPENVLLDKKGRVKIADFGLAKILGQEADFRLTGARDVMGTPHYMAPEQVEKPQEVDHRADIYSLGVVFYEMLTGDLPLGKFDPPSHKVQIDVRLDDVVLRSLANNPDRRYQHASEIKTELDFIAETPSNAKACNRTSGVDRGVDYRSKTTLLGLPLLHVTSGIDPATGKARVSKGIIAIGGRAQGVIAVGGMASGGLAIGGLAIGIFAFGGAAVGVFSFGGLAMALILALGGGSLAPIALGGGAIGYFALGGWAAGMHPLAANAIDPAAKEFFASWGHTLLASFQLINAIIVILAIGLGVGLPLGIRRYSKSPNQLRLREISIAALLLLALLVAAGWIFGPRKGGTNSPLATNREAANAVKAIVHIRRFTAYSPNSPDIEYAATLPLGYALQATARPDGYAHSLPTAGGSDENRVFWNFPFIKPIRPLKPGDFKPGQPPPAMPPQKFDSSEEREAQRKALAGQLQELQDQGPIPIVLGQPKLLFSVTNGSGDISQGFLELVHAETNQLAGTVPGLPIRYVWPQGNETNHPLSPEEQVLLIEQQRSQYPPAAPAPTPEEQATLMEIQRAKSQVAPGPLPPPREFTVPVGGPQKSPPRITSSTLDPQSGLPPSGLAGQPDPDAPLLFAQQPPVVVETFPVSGARDVPSGELEIRVRFSKPMQDGSWSWSTAWENSTPESIGQPRYLSDGRTCLMKVRVERGRTYAWWLNSGTFHNFKDAAGIPSVPYLLIFQTKPN